MPRAKVPMLTPRTMRGGAGASRGTGAGGGGATVAERSALPLGTFGADATTFYSPTSSFASPAASESRSGGGDDYLESMMSDFRRRCSEAVRGGVRTPPRITSRSVLRRRRGPESRDTNSPTMRRPGKTETLVRFTPSDAPASGALVGALAASTAPLEDVSGLRAMTVRWTWPELTRESSSGVGVRRDAC